MTDNDIPTPEQVEEEIRGKLKGYPAPARPRLTVSEEVEQVKVADAYQRTLAQSYYDPPVRTIAQCLTDIERTLDGIMARQKDGEKNIADILGVTNERLGRIENTLGVK